MARACPPVVVFRSRSEATTRGGICLSSRAERNGKALSFLIVLTLALGGVFATVVALTPVARAGTCDQVGGVITQTWTITTTQVCTGILYTVDATININSGGSLTLINGGLIFAKDTAHQTYALNVNAGGELVLDNSIVTTQTDSISPFLKLAFTVTGANSRFKMMNGAILKFPGWFNATSATLNITNSKITGFTDAEISNLGINTDDNNDAPLMAWASTGASLYRSRIERIYEYSGGSTGNLGLTATSNLYAYDSYIGVDFSNVVGQHNELRVDGSSNAYLYNVTIDQTQDPPAMSNWQPAYRPTAAGGSVTLLRWLHATVVDSSGIPIAGATIWSTVSPGSTTAQYPDNGLATTPAPRTLWYLGRTASGANAWNRTDSDGAALIPLYTDQITTASLPNAQSFGNYHEAVTYSASSTAGDDHFNPYPAINATDNNVAITMSFSNLQVCPTGVTTWSFNRQITGEVSVYSCLEISGSVTITDTTINANVPLFGGNASLVRDSFLGPALWIDTVQKTSLWDATLTGVTSLALLTDDGNANTVDFDIRNTTFDQVQTSQLVFGGAQNVQLTSVQTYDPNGTWWVDMITGGAQVSRYWWLRVNAVDGTGTVLADAHVGITVQRLDPNTLIAFTVPNPGVDDIYQAATMVWPVSAPDRSIIYRAFAQTPTTR